MTVDDQTYRPHADEWGSIPYYMRAGLGLWIRHGVIPGDFLWNVLCNDFMGACRHADEMNRHALFAYAAFLHNVAPVGSYGSDTACIRWNAHGGLEGLEKRDEVHPG